MLNVWLGTLGKGIGCSRGGGVNVGKASVSVMTNEHLNI